MNAPFQRPHLASPGSWAKTALLALHASRIHSLAPRALAGAGAILMLHRVRRADDTGFAPNQALEVTPDFLDATIRHLAARGYDFVNLDEAVRRLSEKDFTRPFIVFTLDDGYRDNLTDAAPVFRRQNIPFTVYLSTGLPDGTAELWWVALERVIATAGELRVRFAEEEQSFACGTTAEKNAAWSAIYWRLRAGPEDAMRAEIARLAGEQGIDVAAMTRELALSWDEVRELAADPLASVEAHTADHFALAKLDGACAREQIARGLARHEAELGRRPRHFSYPYGDPGSANERDFALAAEFGFASATTTRKGLIHARHADRLMALPRVSLNGNYQDVRIVEVLLGGLPFALARLFAGASVD
ncbi:polysaccharide deacetylase family protein [Parvibaculum sp.]|uniref:polysaccharide deacetylase family protein n=1 Tax=Parvibaculum sp. TaxID=2024848 RepID=UPI00320C2354